MTMRIDPDKQHAGSTQPGTANLPEQVGWKEVAGSPEVAGSIVDPETAIANLALVDRAKGQEENRHSGSGIEIDRLPYERRSVQWTLAVVALMFVIGSALRGGIARWTPQPQDPILVEPGQPLIEVEINSAEPRELALLPGVGPVLARRIVQYREREGPFSSLDDLASVPGIGPKTIHRLRPLCVVDP